MFPAVKKKSGLKKDRKRLKPRQDVIAPSPPMVQQINGQILNTPVIKVNRLEDIIEEKSSIGTIKDRNSSGSFRSSNSSKNNTGSSTVSDTASSLQQQSLIKRSLHPLFPFVTNAI